MSCQRAFVPGVQTTRAAASTEGSTCPQPFPYQWRSPTASFDLLVILLVAALVTAGWTSLKVQLEQAKKRD